MDKIRRHTFYPKRSAVSRIMKARPDTLFTDDVGRIYGPYTGTPIVDDLEASSEIDNEMRLAWWVHLPRRTIDQNADMSDAGPLTLDEILDFPVEGEWIEYSPYLEPDNILGSFRVLYYPERIQKNGVNASIVVEIM